MSDDVLIEVENVSKKFCRSLKRSLWYGIKDIATELSGQERNHDKLREGEFWAVNDVSFQVKRGECLGLIGSNGAGKTTVLRILNGLIKPDKGKITMRGRVGALIALGAGFNPILTGRENVYAAGAVLGLTTKEINKKYDEIVAFSELEEFMEMPVQNYSSGMHVRLGFAIAAHLLPDIMLVDEALAVGDARFQKKCFDRIQFMLSQGTAFIVVSHNPYQIESLAQKVAVMHKGEMPAVREGKQALSLYHDLVQRELGRTCKTGVTPREGTGLIRFLSVKVDADSVTEYGAFQSMSPLRIVADIEANTPVTGARFRFEILSTNNVIVIKASTRGITEMRKFYGKHTLVFNMTPCQLTSGWYYIDAFASDGGLVRFDSLHKATEFKIINSSLDSLNFSNDDGIFVCHGNWCIE